MSASSSQRLDVVDALRGFAALAVVFYHVWNAIYPWGNTQVAAVLGDPNHRWFHDGWDFRLTFCLFQYGYFGVTIFFVISGFCIHLPQARRRASTGNDGLRLEPFFRRRFWRLYPAYFAALIVAAVGVGVMRIMEFRDKGLTLPPGLYYDAFGISDVAVNALFLLPFFPSAKGLNSVLWTLVFEVQFYLLYPLLLWGLRRVGFVAIGLTLLSAELLLVPGPKTRETFGTHDPWEYFFLARYFEWFLGVAAAELFARRGTVLQPGWDWTGLALGLGVTVASTFLPTLWPFRDLFVAATTLCTLSILLRRPAATPGPVVRVFAEVGVFSYSLYLLHLPLLRMAVAGSRLLGEAVGVSLERTTPMLYLVPWVPAVIALSYGFFWLFERPFLHAQPTPSPDTKVKLVSYPSRAASAAPSEAPAPAVAPAV